MERLDVERYIKNDRFVFTGDQYVTGKMVMTTIGDLVCDREGNKGRIVRALICSKRAKFDESKTNLEAMSYFVYRNIEGITKHYQSGMLREFNCKGITEKANNWLIENNTDIIRGY